MKKLFYLLPIFVLLGACGNQSVKNSQKISLSDSKQVKYEQSLQNWKDKTEEQLIKKWGNPTKTTVSGNKKYLLYKKEDIFSVNGSSYNLYCNTTFTIKNGVVADWKYKGNNCDKATYVVE